MISHAPKNYICPICLAIKGIENKNTMIKQNDIVYKDKSVMAFIGSKFILTNPGHVIIVPIKHYENIYDLPDNVSAKISTLARRLSIAIKEIRKADGINLQQNNEPAAGQHAFHYHLHIIPRFENDGYAKNKTARISKPAERKKYAMALKKYIIMHYA
ncbi:MAG: HIT domain-containing protein [Candidatus Buchananbacteria bacterium]